MRKKQIKSLKDTGCHWFKVKISMIWKNFFWLNTLLVIFTCDSTHLNIKKLFTSFEKGGQLLQHDSHSADLANLIQTMLTKYVYMIYKRKSSPWFTLDLSLWIYVKKGAHSCCWNNLQFFYHSCASLAVLVTSNMFTRLILHQTSSD